MKKIKMILFSMLLLFVSVLTVNAANDINVWQSIVTDLTPNISGENNCKYGGIGDDLLDLFTVGSDCVATGIKAGETFMFGARGDSGTGDGVFPTGKVSASTNNTGDTDVLLSEIVELVYNANSETTKKLVAEALAAPAANGATSFELKAGSSANALYVYGGYNNANKAGIKINFNASTKEFTYTLTTASATTEEAVLASFFTKYLIEYVMEASPNYSKGIEIYNNTEKYNLIKSTFTSTYGDVKYPASPAGIEVKVFAKGDVNDSIVALYEAALNANAGGNENPGNTNNDNENNNDDDGEDNPNTGAFVNIFAIVALISVGTVILLGNKRKLFRI